ncbi:ABC transporter permease [Ornithinibacillus scapharcae]|uniref:ABC transporter permease n=1 Tax=Ornithinibacillus scapharcae TaxID=1147159 RepID=UPI000225B57B|nr:ABC transporter permease subunit [Ornithinibacillus scapharcae]
MRLLGFELKKTLFSKKFLYIIIGVILAISFLFIRNVIFQSYIEKQEQEKVDEWLEVGFSNSKMHNGIVEADPENEEEMNKLVLNSKSIDILYNIRSNIGSDDWQVKLNLENEFLTIILEYKEAKGDHPLTYQEINHKLALNQELLAQNIPPEHETYSLALPNFMKQVVDLFVNYGAILLVLLLIGETMSSEFESRSINLLFTQPLKRTDIITSKFSSSIILYILTTLIMIVANYLIGLIFGDKGQFHYPILMEKDTEINFMTLTEYITIALIVVSLTMLFVIALTILYSLFIKNTLATTFAVLVTLVIGYGINTLITWDPILWINPFQYLLPEETILFQNGHEWYQGIPIIFLVSFILYIIARQKIKTSKVD